MTRSVGTGPGGRDELVYSIARGSWVGLDSFSYTVVDSSGQGATTRLHKESHQILDLVSMFAPITKYSTQVLEPDIVAEVVRKAVEAKAL